MYKLTIATSGAEKLTEIICRDKKELARVVNGAIFAATTSMTLDIETEARNERKTER